MIHCLLFLFAFRVWSQFVFEVKFLNFGNYFIALTNGLHAAALSGNSCVSIAEKHAAFAKLPPLICYESGQYASSQAALASNDSRQTLRSAYFYSDISRHFASSCPDWRRRSEIFVPFAPYVYREVSQARTAAYRDLLSDPKTLVVHLRSGDIFSHYKLEFYWQPPLGYYQVASRGYERLFIVSQTNNNPVIGLLNKHCVATLGSSNCFVKIDRDLKEDLDILLHAESLCVGYGSFGFASAAISTKIKTLIYPYTMLDFSRAASVGIESIAERGSPLVKTIMISYDTRMSHRVQKWAGTPEQMAMLEIDENRLENISQTYIYSRNFLNET